MKVYLRIIGYGRQWFGQGALAVLSTILYNFFSVLSLSMMIPFLEILFTEGGTYAKPDQVSMWDSGSLKAWVFWKIHSMSAELGKFDFLMMFCVALALTIFLKNLFGYMGNYWISPLEQGSVFQMRKKLFDHLSSLNMSYFTGEKKGQIINILVTDVQIIQQSVVGTLRNMIKDPVSVIMILITMFLVSWKLSLFTLTVIPVAGFFISKISKSIKVRARTGQEKLGNLISVIDEFVSGIRIVKAFRTEPFEREKYAKENDYYQHMMIGLNRRSALASPLTEVLSIGVIIGIILFGANMIFNGSGELEPSLFLYFIALFSQFLAPIKTLSGAISRIQRGIASFNRVEEFLAIQETIAEAPNAIGKSEFESEVEFENVSFAYDEEKVLDQVSFRLEKGKTVALVGPSGGGKSTLADLLPRFYDPVEGQIRLDGRDLREYKLRDLRRLFGVVTQEGILFNDTVLHNIAYGDLKPDLKRAEEAAQIANAHGFISEMAEGYHTPIGERGTRLSGGQRQRLAIARAIYLNPPILVLDEATSALDSESERLVQEALRELMKERTSLIIAHRLSTITHADLILVVDKGRIAESGNHEELVQQGGLYRALYDIQFGENS